MQVSVPAAEAVLDALRTEVVILDGDGRIVAYNQAWQDFSKENHGPDTDWKGQDYLGASVGPEGGDAARSGIRDVLAGKRPSFELEYPCHSPQEERWFEMVVTRLEDLVVIAHENVTARHQAERFRQQLWRHAHSVKERDRRDRFLQQFLHEVAHSVRDPLATLKQQMESVRDAIRPWKEIQASLDRLDHGTQRLEQTGSALAKPFQTANFSIAYLGDLLEEHAPEAARRDLRLTAGHLESSVTTDPDVLQECMACLVATAVGGCPAGGRVHLDSVRSDDHVKVVLTADAGLVDDDAEVWRSAARELSRQGSYGLTQVLEDAQQVYTIEVAAADRS